MTKVLVIGLDGVPFTLLDSLFDRDVMPFLQSLKENGYYADLLSTVPPISATAWATFATGLNPGRHGILQFVNLRPASDSKGGGAQWVFPGCASLLNADSIRGATLWQLLSEAGRRQVIVNVPLTYPPRAINGVMVTGMLTPPSAPVFTYPPELSERLRQEKYEIDVTIQEKEFDFDPKRLIFRLREILEKRGKTCLQLMKEQAWDFFMVVFTGTDRVQHRFWKYLDPCDAEYTTPEAIRLRPYLDQYFKELDQVIADLIRTAGPDTQVMILSDHGFGPAPDRTVYSLSMMQALGLEGAWTKSGVVRLRRLIEGRLGLNPSQVSKWARAVLPEGWVARLDARFRNAQLAAGAQSLAYAVTLHSYIGGIYINRQRFPDEKAFEAFRQRVMADLKGLVDPSNGQPFVTEVHTKEELYLGAAAPSSWEKDPLSECPDILFFLAPEYGLSGGVGPGGKLVSERRRDLNKQGIHRDIGILILYGPGFQKGKGPQEKLQDVTATILHWLDVPIPSTMDSQPILRALEPDLIRQRPPRYSDAPTGGQGLADGSASWISQKDQEELMERLRGLGYID